MELDDFTSVLASSDLFAMCTGEQKRLLAFASEQKIYAAGDTIYARGDESAGAFVLMSGLVQAGEPNDAAHSVHKISQTGTVFGELGLIVARPRRATLFALSETRLLFVPRSAFKKLLRQNTELAQHMVSRVEGDIDSFLSSMTRFTK